MTTTELPVVLSALGDELLEQARTDARGRAAHIVVKEPVLRSTMIALMAGRGLSEHNAPAAATLQCLAGEAMLRSPGHDWALTAGSLVPIPPARHSVDAITDCVLLLTVAIPS